MKLKNVSALVLMVLISICAQSQTDPNYNQQLTPKQEEALIKISIEAAEMAPMKTDAAAKMGWIYTAPSLTEDQATTTLNSVACTEHAVFFKKNSAQQIQK